MKKKLVALLARQRSGTHALRSVLESHPQIHCFGEVLNNDDYEVNMPYSFIAFARRSGRYENPANHVSLFEEFVQTLPDLHNKPISLIDLKFTGCHLVSADWKYLTEVPLFNWLRRNEIPIIRLRRDNYLRVALSEEVARKRNAWHDDVNVPPPSIDAVLPDENGDIEQLLRLLTTWHREDQLVSETFADHPWLLELHYAEVFPRLGAPIAPATLQQISTFLGVENTFSTETWCGKSNRRPLRDCVSNWAEVCQGLRGTRFEYCLTDEPMFRSGQAAQEQVIQLKSARDLSARFGSKAA